MGGARRRQSGARRGRGDGVVAVVEARLRVAPARGVAERAGTAVGSVYTQFDSLELLRLEANAVTMRRLRDTLAGALAACSSRATEARLLCLADAYLAFAAANHAAGAAIFERRTVAAPDSVQADIAALFGILEGVLRDGGRLAEPAIPVMATERWALEFSSAPSAIIRATGSETAPRSAMRSPGTPSSSCLARLV